MDHHLLRHLGQHRLDLYENQMKKYRERNEEKHNPVSSLRMDLACHLFAYCIVTEPTICYT